MFCLNLRLRASYRDVVFASGFRRHLPTIEKENDSNAFHFFKKINRIRLVEISRKPSCDNIANIFQIILDFEDQVFFCYIATSNGFSMDSFPDTWATRYISWIITDIYWCPHKLTFHFSWDYFCDRKMIDFKFSIFKERRFLEVYFHNSCLCNKIKQPHLVPEAILVFT